MRISRLVLAVAGVLLTAGASTAQPISTLVVEIRTGDVRFAGTDDDVHLIFGGREFPLDDPQRDDFERNHRDRFLISLADDPLSIELIRGIGQISVIKMQDSFFGGGWRFGGITVWAETDASEPLFKDDAIDKWLDGDDLEWTSTLGDPGWNVPEPQPFPPCTGTIIIFAAGGRAKALAAGGDPSKDSDCDGISDDQDPTFDPPQDSDGDGLPDLFETQTGTNPNSSDTDGDGWADGRNKRSVLVLTKIETGDEQEDIGSDELYLVTEDIRYPKSFDLDGYWSMDDGQVRSPGVIVDSRMRPAGAPPASFISRMKLRESDFTFFERPTDDTFTTFELQWNENGTTVFTFDSDDAKYVLTFKWFTMDVRDPTNGNADTDGDGLDEAQEAKMSLQDPSVQPIASPGHDGLADPERRELWVEVDSSGSDPRLKFDAKQMVASQFAYHGIAPRLDDGWFGNENNGSVTEKSVIRPADIDAFLSDPGSFRPERRALSRAFRYVLMANDLEGGAGSFGDTRCPGICRSIVSGVPVFGHTMTAQAQPIIFMHEVGHTLGLCHRMGDRDPVNPACPAPPGVRCADFCGIGQESNTAMGSETGGDTATPIVGGALTGIGAGIVIGGLIGFSIGGPPGGIVGAIIGGIVGGIGGAIAGAVFGADFYAREVDYDLREWAKLRVGRP